MALLKDLEVKGITCNYWKILKAVNVYASDATKITLGVYPSKTVRDEDINYNHASETVLIEGTDLTREAMYTAIKAVEGGFFADATDDI